MRSDHNCMWTVSVLVSTARCDVRGNLGFVASPLTMRRLCRYVICTQHDLHFLPYINVPASRVAWLIAMCGRLAGLHVHVRGLRASMVMRLVMESVVLGKPMNEVLMRHIGTWVQNISAAAMVAYFSNKAAAAAMAGMV